MIRERLTLGQALERAEARSPSRQDAITCAYRRSREHAGVAETLWLADDEGDLDAARRSLELALEAVAHLSDAEEEGDDPAAALRERGLGDESIKEILEAESSDSLGDVLSAARKVRRAVGIDHRGAADIRRQRRARWAALAGLVVLAIGGIVMDVRRRIALANAPWSVSYWDNPDFEGSPSTEVGWLVPSHRWDDGGPFSEHDAFSLRLETCLHLDAPAALKVTLRSDDGSRAYVDGELLVDNWGDHGAEVSQGEVELEAGTHAFRVDYYERGGGAQLGVDIDTEADYELSPGSDGCD